MDEPTNNPQVLPCDECGTPADRVHVLPSSDRPERLSLACGAHDPGGDRWFLREVDDLERALRNASVFDELRPGVSDSMRKALERLLAREVELPCAVCSTVRRVRADAHEFACARCGRSNGFWACMDCGAVEQPRRRERWWCGFCGHNNRPEPWNLRRPRSATAAQRLATLQQHGLATDGGDVGLVGGFTCIGGTGFNIQPGSVCSLVAHAKSLLVTVEIGVRPDARSGVIRYEELTALELAGGARTTGGGVFGGGFGLKGAWEGMVAASVLNALSRKTTVSTGMRIGSVRGEILLHHSESTPDRIRTALSLAFSGFEVARQRLKTHSADRPGDPVERLERLAELHQGGALTDEEFAAAKRRLLGA